MSSEQISKFGDPIPDPIPDDLAGFQNVTTGLVLAGDLVINPRGAIKQWANGLIGESMREDGTTFDGWRVYRRIPVAKHLDRTERQPLVPERVVSGLPSSGKTMEFTTGAVRDAMEGKGMPHMIPPVALRKLARRFEDGARKYARNNWMKGIPLSRYQDSLMRHLMAWSEGQTDEDHMGAILWNAAGAAWTEEAIAAGKLPKDLNDLPFRE